MRRLQSKPLARSDLGIRCIVVVSRTGSRIRRSLFLDLMGKILRCFFVVFLLRLSVSTSSAIYQPLVMKARQQHTPLQSAPYQRLDYANLKVPNKTDEFKIQAVGL